MFTTENTPYGNGETLVIVKQDGREVASLVLSPRTTGGLGVEVWQYADDAHPLQTVEVPASK